MTKYIRTSLFLTALVLAAGCRRDQPRDRIKAYEGGDVCRTIDDNIWACVSDQRVYLCLEDEDGVLACGTFAADAERDEARQ